VRFGISGGELVVSVAIVFVSARSDMLYIILSHLCNNGVTYAHKCIEITTHIELLHMLASRVTILRDVNYKV